MFKKRDNCYDKQCCLTLGLHLLKLWRPQTLLTFQCSRAQAPKAQVNALLLEVIKYTVRAKSIRTRKFVIKKVLFAENKH